MSNTQKAKDVGLYFWSKKITWHRPRYLQQTERDEQDGFYRIKKISDTQKLIFRILGSKSASVASADYNSNGKCVQCVEDGMFKKR